MGLIKAAVGAIGGALADQWKEYIYCDALPNNVLMTKGACRVSERSSNTRGDSNVISDGSVIAVNEGQFMIVVEDGRKYIGRTLDINVTSVLQTAAGRMIFGKVK